MSKSRTAVKVFAITAGLLALLWAGGAPKFAKH